MTNRFFSQYRAYWIQEPGIMTLSANYRMACIVSALLLASISLFIPAAAVELSSGGATAISNGDPVTLRGIATGHPQSGLQVWVIGNNYLKTGTIDVNQDNSFTYELKSADTRNLASGQYFVVVQHPMMNGEFDVYYNSATGRVINRQMGTGGMTIYQMSGSGSLQGPDSAQALVNAISSQDIDDTFTTYTFMINPPAAFVEPVGTHAVGDKFTIAGSTNLAVGDDLLVEITSSSFKPTQKNTAGGFSGASGTVKVVRGTSGTNRWSFDVDASEFAPDEYIVKVSGVTIDVTGSTTFNIVDRLTTFSTTAAIVSHTDVQQPVTTADVTPATTVPATATTKAPLFPVVAIAGCLMAFLVKKIRN